ncbi:hypothetical protein LFWB_1650 [Candidatus Phytoplasma luffae]|uniref:Uncharacterized protein n=1 Tax=Loofah witches'-broom phytoplasma TaxID=35773 RepID=A0A975ILU7_LOWBP|nr:hypothetical protein [Candidatus Phytoplasma luffae]QTX02735.1 hypothetical protein LFWB_1650 [Candidatus Phytoplasma luffae]
MNPKNNKIFIISIILIVFISITFIFRNEIKQYFKPTSAPTTQIKSEDKNNNKPNNNKILPNSNSIPTNNKPPQKVTFAEPPTQQTPTKLQVYDKGVEKNPNFDIDEIKKQYRNGCFGRWKFENPTFVKAQHFYACCSIIEEKDGIKKNLIYNVLQEKIQKYQETDLKTNHVIKNQTFKVEVTNEWPNLDMPSTEQLFDNATGNLKEIIAFNSDGTIKP